MTPEMSPFFDGTRWNREAVVAAQQARATANAQAMGWEPRAQSFLSAPLAPEVVATFEATYGIRLPEEYRAFLLQVGDGGDGPGLAMRPLGAPFDDGMPWEEGEIFRAPDEPNELLAQSFAHQGPVEVAAPDAPLDIAAGALYLFDHGCALWDLLVVTGPAAGEIWQDRIADDAGLRPAMDADGARMGFAAYYCQWLLQV